MHVSEIERLHMFHDVLMDPTHKFTTLVHILVPDLMTYMTYTDAIYETMNIHHEHSTSSARAFSHTVIYHSTRVRVQCPSVWRLLRSGGRSMVRPFLL